MSNKNKLKIFAILLSTLMLFNIGHTKFFYHNDSNQLIPLVEDNSNDDSSTSSDPKVVRPSKIHDRDGDKIADTLSQLINAKSKGTSQSPNALRDNGKKVEVMICVNKKPDLALIEKFTGLGAEILSIYDNLIYAVAAVLPIDKIFDIAADPLVTLIENQAYSKAHLDTSTINMGVRGSSYVWNATPSIKGNPNYSIAILDTGVDSTNLDMQNFLFFHDFTYHGYPNGSIGYDYGHHGTHCASIAAGTGVGDIDPTTINQTISYHFHPSINYYYTTHWFEVKDNSNKPNTTVTLDWNTSGSGSAKFGIRNSIGSYITSNGPYSTSPITHNLGNITAGWYQVVVYPTVAATCNKDYTITIKHEYNYTLSTESLNTPIFTGVAPQSKIVSLKVLDDTGSGIGTWFLNALDWVSLHGKDPAYNITTVSMSIGFDGIYSSIDTAVNNLVNEGFICVSSAGNDGTNNGYNAIDSPGTAQKCITVGAVNDAFEVVYYSSNGDTTYNKPDVIAPGGTVALYGSNSPHNLILAADSNYGEDENSMTDLVANDYRGMQGTSMSCPHVAGLAQLVIDAIIKTEGNWSWSQANALRVKQLICMGTWEVDAGETIDWDGDGMPQNPPLNRVGSDVVEGYGMVRADAVIQAITHPASETFNNEAFYLDRRNDSHAMDSKVLLFSLNAKVGEIYNFSLNVPATGDFDLIIYDNDYNSTTGRPIILTSSINNGLGINESLGFVPAENGTYYWSIRAAQGYGTCQITVGSDPTWVQMPTDQAIEFGDSFSYDVNATDPSGIDYYWINDTTYFSINATSGLITNNTALYIGVYWLEIRAYDPYGNNCSADIKISVATDPTWDQIPIDQASEFGDSFSYDVNATDPSGIDYYWINDTTYFSINATSGLITNNTALSVDEYWLEVRAYDPYGNNCSADIKISVNDTTDPTWDQIPTDQASEFGDSFNYNVDSSDLSGIALYWINDTTYFSINPISGLITNDTALSVDEYWLEVRAYDPYGNNCSADIKISVKDTTDPTWDQPLTYQSITYGDSFSYDVNASDLSGIALYWINDTTYFSINPISGLITNILTLHVGEYWLEVRAYDPYGNNCSAIIKITVMEKPIPGFLFSPVFFILSIIGIIYTVFVKKKREDFI
ncbi:MAG: S8 family serine peptidase [Promethearchaeota archaeon]